MMLCQEGDENGLHGNAPESITESCRSVEEMMATCPPPASHFVSVLIPEDRAKRKEGEPFRVE